MQLFLEESWWTCVTQLILSWII